jgi:hypothetical protein
MVQPRAERITDVFRPGRHVTGSRHPQRLDGRPVSRVPQARVGEIEVEDTEQNVEQGADDVGRLAATPEPRQGEKTDEIVDARPETAGLIQAMWCIGGHRQIALEGVRLAIVPENVDFRSRECGRHRSTSDAEGTIRAGPNRDRSVILW